MRPIRIVGDPEPLEFSGLPNLERFYILSPFGLFLRGEYQMLLRLVNRDVDASKKVSLVHFATSSKGTEFEVGPAVIEPGRTDEPDGAGCEDPTAAHDGESYTVFYSGYSAIHQRSSMLACRGSTLNTLAKVGVILPPDDAYANPKEAALVSTSRGFRMFFEYARNGASNIGVADAAELLGPWTYAESPITQRADAFDSWHLSPSSAIRRSDGTHVLFYNGASKGADWRINYVIMDETATVVLERPRAPLVNAFGLKPGDTNIAFAASAPVAAPGVAWLYYSISDRKTYRSRLDIDGALCDSASPHSVTRGD